MRGINGLISCLLIISFLLFLPKNSVGFWKEAIFGKGAYEAVMIPAATLLAAIGVGGVAKELMKGSKPAVDVLVKGFKPGFIELMGGEDNKKDNC